MSGKDMSPSQIVMGVVVGLGTIAGLGMWQAGVFDGRETPAERCAAITERDPEVNLVVQQAHALAPTKVPLSAFRKMLCESMSDLGPEAQTQPAKIAEYAAQYIRMKSAQ